MDQRSRLLELPAEIRLRILDHLFIRPGSTSTTSPSHMAAAAARGFTDGVGHITLVREQETWKSISTARPPGFCLHPTAILRVCRLLHMEAMDMLYGKILFVINVQNMRPIAPPFVGCAHAIVATPGKRSVFFQGVDHVHIRQHVRPEDDLLQKAQVLRSLLQHLNPTRRTTEVTLHFDSMWLVNDGEWPRTARPEYVWQLYSAELARMDLGRRPSIRVSSHWIEIEGSERFQNLAKKVGGRVCLGPHSVHLLMLWQSRQQRGLYLLVMVHQRVSVCNDTFSGSDALGRALGRSSLRSDLFRRSFASL